MEETEERLRELKRQLMNPMEGDPEAALQDLRDALRELVNIILQEPY